MIPQRIQLSRAKGWRMPTDTVKVDRSTYFGNPFPVDCYGQERAVDLFRRWMTGNMSSREMSGLTRSDRWSGHRELSLVTVRQFIRDDLHKLAGKNLACWCKIGSPCHADVLLAIVNGGEA